MGQSRPSGRRTRPGLWPSITVPRSHGLPGQSRPGPAGHRRHRARHRGTVAQWPVASPFHGPARRRCRSLAVAARQQPPDRGGACRPTTVPAPGPGRCQAEVTALLPAAARIDSLRSSVASPLQPAWQGSGCLAKFRVARPPGVRVRGWESARVRRHSRAAACRSLA